MSNYLTPEQEAEFMRQLESASDGAASELTPEQQQAALDEGAQMAAADAGDPTGAPSNEPAPDVAAPAPDPSTQRLSELGFESVDQLVEAYQQANSGQSELKELLTKLVSIRQAEQNASDLDPNDPDAAVKRAVRDQLAPIREKMEMDARNRIVQDSWRKSAEGKADLEQLMPEISAFLGEHPELSVADDGLERAYTAVRSKKYRPESELLSDPEFVRRMAANEKVKNLVLEKHLQGIARSGDQIPATISSGGGEPLTPAKAAPSGMEQAKRQLQAMLEQQKG